MSKQAFRARSFLPHPPAEVFAWHAREGALDRLLPPWSGVTVESRSGSVRDEGSTVVLRMPVGPLGARWVATHHDCVEGRSFRDVQASGPFSYWSHTHRMEPAPGGCMLEDEIEFAPPLAPLSGWIAAPLVRAMLGRQFAWRHRRTREDLAAHARAGLSPLRVAISGATGLVGQQLSAFLSTGGHHVVPLVRGASASGAAARAGGAAASAAGAAGSGTAAAADAPSSIAWDPAAGTIDAEAFEGIDAVVHLAGESIASSRWTEESKRRVLESRTRGTRLLCEALAARSKRPRVLVSASAIGFYGDRGNEALDESSPPGSGFLSEVCRQWEDATAPAREAGIRVVNLRIGVVLSPLGGALASMLPAFRLGLGGPVGPGTQFVSWISLDDAVAGILHAIATPALEGPVNLVAPTPVPNAELGHALGKALHRPAILPAPAFALRLLLGEMADALLLSSTRVLPRRLIETGFVFRDPQLAPALADMLGSGPSHLPTPAPTDAQGGGASPGARP